MNAAEKEMGFFLGTNTPNGYVSFFGDALSYMKNKKVYIMRGGPGTGKSTLLNSIYDVFSHTTEIEKIYCSGDVSSLDGLIFKEKGVAIADGTAPHAIEPMYPGALECEINLNEIWDKEKLYKRRDEIISLSRQKRISFERASRFLGAASSLLNDTYRIALENTNTEKAEALAGRIAEREIPRIDGKRGNEMPRFLSTLTDKGIVFLNKTLKSSCDKIYVLEDEYGAASRAFMKKLKCILKNSGYDFYTCFCPFSPFDKIDHILIPSLNLGFATKSKSIDMGTEAYRTIHSHRFENRNKFYEKRSRLKFNKKACDVLLKETSDIISEVNSIHKSLESIYGDSMNFEKIDEIKQRVIDEISKF